ncbi:putative late blight resistance protein R1C-3 [Capsicum annuum]|uniref:putative late blight resistance protein homolog R1C-3 n=1 Tax=Capsicum annuum TaxID=4072 RepID=UPI001FB14820|nr:putative late blight resistance protein homolog R1C-3 [Capsicum annuum]XP_047268904.1 putative late blight resistance protein homolog R1C-3 [Capsicum annuum]XP_047268905.1 putative late blight resistance protein homolog R1C-3 [Capsicum annuum]XP_047268906.1 putative late blight resistance protein homolog R1C-3 [Capsicum annuum]
MKLSCLDQMTLFLYSQQLRILRTFVLFGNTNLDGFHTKMSQKLDKFERLVQSLFYQDEDDNILSKYDMDDVAHRLMEDIKSYLSLKHDFVAMTTEEKTIEYWDSLLKNLHYLPKYCAKLFLPLMNEYKILRQVCRHLGDFYRLIIKGCIANKTTEYLYPRLQMTADIVTEFCFDHWCNEKLLFKYGTYECSSKIASLLLEIIPVELEVLYICTSKVKESRSTELEGFVKQILKASPRILQNYLILLQGRMAGAVAVNALTQSIYIMMEFLLIFYTDIPKRFIHRDKLNDMLAHLGVLTREISILVNKSSENMINEANFATSDFFQEVEQIKGELRQMFLKAPKSSQRRFPMDDGLLFINLLLRHLNDLPIASAYLGALMKKEIRMVKECLEFLRSFFGEVRQRLDHNGLLKNLWARALDVAYEAEHVINSILVRDNSLSHLIFSLPSIIDKIKLIVAEVTRLQLEDKNGDPLDAKSSDETIGLTSSPLVEVIVGLEEEVNWIIDQLFDEQAELDVISIVRMPGLGKTTLTNKVYNNTLVASRFKVRAWCTVSQKYNKSKVLQKILNQVTGFEEKECGDDIAEKLRGALYDRRYLIILDDVWDIATGEMLISCFPKVERGNRIILTSRNSKVALQLKFHSDPFHLQLLTPEKKVFGEGNCPELSDVGHQIVEKCQGLPLAVVLIAGVIVRMKGKKKDSWHKIQHNLDSFISGNNLQTMKVMQLSYDYLPDHLKPLLLYFGGTRKRKRTPVYKLIQLLMAEGFVDHIPSKSSLEETTQSYLDALISSSLIMVSEKPVETSPFYIKVKVCYVHDVVHDFCSVKVKKETFFKFINSGAPVHASDFINRHVTIHTESQLHKKCVVFNSSKSSGTGSYKHLISLKVNNNTLVSS